MGGYWVICGPVLLIDWLGYGGDDCSADFIIGSEAGIGQKRTSDLILKIDFEFTGLLVSRSAYGQTLDRASRSVKKLSERIALMVTCRFLTVLAECVGVPVSPFPLS